MQFGRRRFAGRADWRAWVARFGCRVIDMDPVRHDILCAWISHLPQFIATALSALLEDEFAANTDLLPIGGRALREMTRLGASPFSMWRDIAHTNSDAIAKTLHALEQRLAHIRENLKTPELREEFDGANRFRLRDPEKTVSGRACCSCCCNTYTRTQSPPNNPCCFLRHCCEQSQPVLETKFM